MNSLKTRKLNIFWDYKIIKQCYLIKNIIELFDNYWLDYTCMWSVWIEKLRHTYLIISLNICLTIKAFYLKGSIFSYHPLSVVCPAFHLLIFHILNPSKTTRPSLTKFEIQYELVK